MNDLTMTLTLDTSLLTSDIEVMQELLLELEVQLRKVTTHGLNKHLTLEYVLERHDVITEDGNLHPSLVTMEGEYLRMNLDSLRGCLAYYTNWMSPDDWR